MNRRHLAAGLAGATLLPAITQAQAQTATPRPPQIDIPRPLGGTVPAPAGAAPGAAARAADQPWQETLEKGVFAVVTSQLAATRAENALLKSFAGFEVAEQRSIIQAMQLAGMPVPSQLRVEGEEARLMQQLEGAQGAAFDQLYLRLQITGHQDLLRLHQGLKSAGTRDQKIISTMAAVTADQHLRILQAMQNRQGQQR